jgi:hypothetical protein
MGVDDTNLVTYTDEKTFYSVPLIYPIAVLVINSLITALIAHHIKNTNKLREKFPDKILSYISKES